VFTELVGVSLPTLRSDHGQRTISLSMLVRPARLLEISLDEFVLTDAVTPPAASPHRGRGARQGRGRDGGGHLRWPARRAHPAAARLDPRPP
jgi:hypothetical protein